MTIEANYIPRVVRPRIEGGCDWESKRIVLLRLGRKELWWWQSRKSWAGRMDGYQPEPAELVLVDFLQATLGLPKTTTLHRGGRLSIGLVHKHEKAIDEWFGHDGVATLVKVRFTTVLCDVKPPTKAERIVDAVGEALGVDTGVCSGAQFVAAVAAANKILED